MTDEAFNEVFEKQVVRCRDILCKKAEEYADKENDDRLHNFKCAAGLQNRDPKDSLWGMMTKHLVSITDMCQDKKNHPMDMWDEKITDALNYLFLLKGLVVEEYQEKKMLEDQIRFAKADAEMKAYNLELRRQLNN